MRLYLKGSNEILVTLPRSRLAGVPVSCNGGARRYKQHSGFVSLPTVIQSLVVAQPKTRVFGTLAPT